MRIVGWTINGTKGAFANNTGTARTEPIIVLFILGTPLKTKHLQEHAQSIQNSMGCRI